jgi:hypothetical protein
LLYIGRPRSTDSCTDDDITDFAVATKFITPNEIKRIFELPISSTTITRRLYEVGLHCRVARVEYRFTEEHIEKRLKFANE